MTKKAVVKKEEGTNLPAASAMPLGTENIDSEDISIPKILCAQKMSDAVDDGDVKPGDFYESLNREILDEYDKTDPKGIKLVFFGSYKQWIVNEDGKFKEILEYTAQNKNLPAEEVIDGKTYKRYVAHNYYCLPYGDVLADPEASFPHVISFKSTSTKAARTINTVVMKMAKKGLPLWSTVFEINRVQKENEKGKYYVMTAKAGVPAEESVKKECHYWYDQLMSAKAKFVVDSEAE